MRHGWMFYSALFTLLNVQLLLAESTAPPTANVASALLPLIQQNEIQGAVTVVAARDKVLSLEAVGWSDVAHQHPMKTDTIFWIASMSKPVTGVAICMLIDEGKLTLDDPVSKFIPEFASLKDKEGQPVAITVKQLLTHTSGLSDFKADELENFRLLADVTPLYLSKPVNFEPGSQWKYCQSGINTAARIVEVLSGQTFDQFLNERLFQPLGMKDTAFWLTPEQAARRVEVCERTPEGELIPSPKMKLYDRDGLTAWMRFPAGNGGLFSTAPDYASFARMLLNGGELDGKRYLSPEGVKLLSTVHSGDLVTGFTPGNGWGVGVCVVREPQGVTRHLKPGTFGHGGAYGTQAWIDPQQDRVVILMIQRSNLKNGDGSAVREAFQNAVFAP
ncbi:serine hydrolase domain-containing protein [Planctomicrobium sp. SH664]|uniref:serine hydrolase domain-containing protein n=1 Tax=Planctomicrobium sp. SH664 TaxID=3448125 RepID=UPI003F5B685F